tara:strand:- start:1086 stop:1649 length:564 start_codon:yes stop_codon:yes gene_type:complete
MWQYNGITIRAGKSWTDSSGVKHPSNWMNWSDAEKKAAGMTEVADPQPYDNRFYHGRDGSGNLIAKSLVDVNATDADGNNVLDEDGNQVVIEGLRTVWKNSVKETAGSLLAATDWYVIRKAEDSTTTIPSSVTTYRAAVRTKSGQIEAAIDGASDIAAFVALFDTPVDSNGNPTGNPPISDWPSAID